MECSKFTCLFKILFSRNLLFFTKLRDPKSWSNMKVSVSWIDENTMWITDELLNYQNLSKWSWLLNWIFKWGKKCHGESCSWFLGELYRNVCYSRECVCFVAKSLMCKTKKREKSSSCLPDEILQPETKTRNEEQKTLQWKVYITINQKKLVTTSITTTKIKYTVTEIPSQFLRNVHRNIEKEMFFVHCH